MARFVWLAFVWTSFLLVIPTAAGAQPTDAPTPAVSWLRSRATPLAGPDATITSDLTPLSDALKDVQVVGLGEAAHGAKEFFQLKRRIVQFLVTRLGFTAIAVESSLSDMEPLDDYIVHGRGTLAEALTTQGYIAYDNDDFMALMAWLRDYNRTLPVERRVRIFGIDVMASTRGRARILDYLRAHHPERLAEVDAIFRMLAEEQAKTPLSHSRDRIASVLFQLQNLHAFFTTERARLVGTQEATDLDALLGYSRAMGQWSSTGPPSLPGTVSRSYVMGLNVLEILSRAPEAKVIVWASNTHVARRTDARSSVGGEVGRALGSRYYAIALEFGQGAVQARPPDAQRRVGPVQQMEVPSVPPDSLPGQLSQVMPQDFFVDLRFSRTPAMSKWLEQPILAHAVAWNQQPTNPSSSNLTVGQYDGLLFVHRTSPARPTKGATELAAKGEGI